MAVVKVRRLAKSAVKSVDMNGRLLKIGVASPSAQHHPQEDAQDDVYGHIAYMNSRESIVLLDLLSKRINFTYQIVNADNDGLGLQQADGSFSGLLGLLQAKRIDLIASRVPSLPNLKQFFDFSIPLGHEEWVTLQQHPPAQNSPTALLSPFEFQVWILVALSVICIIPIMYVIHRCYVRLTDTRPLFRKRNEEKISVKFSDYVLFVIVSLLRQNHTLQVKIDSQRLLMATWWIVGTVLTTFYTANLTAELARPVKASAVRHPSELRLQENSEIKWLTLQGEALHSLTRVPGDGFMRDLSGDLEIGRGHVIASITRAVSLVEREGYVWFGPRHTLMQVLLSSYRFNDRNNVTRSKLCTFLVTEKPYLSVEYGMLLPKNSSLTANLNQALRMIDQAGISTLLHRPTFTGKNPCSSGGTSHVVRAMQTGDLIGLFYIFIVGLSLSTVAFLAERIQLCASIFSRRWMVRTRRSQIHAPAVVPPTRPVLIFKETIDEELETLSEQIDQILRHSLAIDDLR